jgi:hypothetical protein
VSIDVLDSCTDATDRRIADLAEIADALHRVDGREPSVVRQRLAVCLALRTLELAEADGIVVWDRRAPTAAGSGCILRDLWLLSRTLIVADAARHRELMPALAALVDMYVASVASHR